MSDGGPTDAGLDGAGTGDLGAGGSDGSPGDGGGLDPSTCMVGPADGCCPLAIRYGGSDPDCAALTCTTLTSTTPITLDVDTPSTTSVGPAALAWTGRGLAIGWVKGNDLWFERRDAAGVLTLAPVAQTLIPGPDFPNFAFGTGVTSLGYSAARGDFAFSAPVGTTQFVLGLGADGADAWNLERLPQIDMVDGFVGVFDVGDAWLATQTDDDGNANDSNGFETDRVGADGMLVHTLLEKVNGHGAALRPGAGLLTVKMADLPMTANLVDPQTLAVGATTTLESNTSYEYSPMAAAFDGSRYGMVFNERHWDPSMSALLYDTYFAIYDPAQGSTTLKALSTNGATWLVEARIAWTGGSWFVVTTAGVDTDAPASTDLHTDLVHLGPSGDVLETKSVTAAHSRGVDVAFVGDRVAVTWIEDISGSAVQTHKLSYYGCN